MRCYDPKWNMPLQLKYLSSLTAQLRTRSPGRLLGARPRCGPLPIGASRPPVRWNSGNLNVPRGEASRQWAKCMTISALVATGVAGWALGRYGLRAESQELQVRYATVRQMEGVSDPSDATHSAESSRMRKEQVDGWWSSSPILHTTSAEFSASLHKRYQFKQGMEAMI